MVHGNASWDAGQPSGSQAERIADRQMSNHSARPGSAKMAPKPCEGQGRMTRKGRESAIHQSAPLSGMAGAIKKHSIRTYGATLETVAQNFKDDPGSSVVVVCHDHRDSPRHRGVK